MPQSPELAGGEGFTFSDNVAAFYLIALLQRGYAPGIESQVVIRVALEQRDFGEPLDDLVVDFQAAEGQLARLSLQVKRSLTISAAKTNPDFRAIIRDCWATLSKTDFRLGVDRYGAAVGDVAAGKARDLRTLCELAKASATAADFEVRFTPSGNASAAVTNIKGDIETLIGECCDGTPNVEAIHNFFAHFVLIEYDFLHDGGTSQPTALNVLQGCLAAGHANQAPSVWSMLCRLAREGAGKSRVFDRLSLVRILSAEFRFAGVKYLQKDVARITALAREALSDISDSVGGTHLHRPKLATDLSEQRVAYRLVQVRGLPGSGKSAVLRHAALTDLANGPVMLLKSGRLEGTGWSGFARRVDLSQTPLEDL